MDEDEAREEKWKKEIRSLLLTEKDGMTEHEFLTIWTKELRKIPVPGFRDLHNYFRSMPDMVEICRYQGNIVYKARPSETSKHVAKLVMEQNTHRKKMKCGKPCGRLLPVNGGMPPLATFPPLTMNVSGALLPTPAIGLPPIFNIPQFQRTFASQVSCIYNQQKFTPTPQSSSAATAQLLSLLMFAARPPSPLSMRPHMAAPQHMFAPSQLPGFRQLLVDNTQPRKSPEPRLPTPEGPSIEQMESEKKQKEKKELEIENEKKRKEKIELEKVISAFNEAIPRRIKGMISHVILPNEDLKADDVSYMICLIFYDPHVVAHVYKVNPSHSIQKNVEDLADTLFNEHIHNVC